MSDPDVKLDREILAKIHNQLKQQSDRIDYLQTYLDSTSNWIELHTKHHMDNSSENSQHIADDMEIKDCKYRIMDMIRAQENEIHKLNIRFDKELNKDKK